MVEVGACTSPYCLASVLRELRYVRYHTQE